MRLRPSFCLALILALIGRGAAPVAAQDQQYAISNYDVRLALQPDGAFRVTESIRFDFQRGAFTQGFRSIPTDALDSLRAVQVRSSDVAVTKVEHGEDGDTYAIKWTYPKRSRPTPFTLTYTVAGALYTEDRHNVIDWQAIGDEWSVPIHDVDVTVSMPFGDVPRDSIAVRPEREATLERTGAGWTASFAHNALEDGEGYRVIVRFPERIATTESGDEGGKKALTVIGLVVLGLLSGVIPLIMWRGPSVDPATIANPQPPTLSLPHAAFLAHKSSTGRFRMFSAVLFDLAQRGHVTLRRETKDAWLSSNDVVTVHVDADPFGLNDFEADLLDAIQQHDTLKAFGQQASSFQRKKLKQMRKHAIAQGWFEAHPARSNRLLIGGAVLVAGAIASPFVLAGWAAPIAAGGLGGAGAGALVAGSKRHTITAEGAQRKAEVLAYLDALREQIDAQRDSNPTTAATQLLNHLPWLVLDPEVNKAWLDELKDALADVDAELALPDWLDDAVDPTDEATSAAAAAFIPIYVTIMNTSAATGAGAVAGGAAGAGAAGGAGGGGGGAA